MRTHLSLATLLLISTALATGMANQDPDGGNEFTADFRLETANLVPNGRNAYFSLQPGTISRFEGDDEGELVELEIRVLDQTRLVTFGVDGQTLNVVTRVIREREWVDGELVEISRNFFARDTKTGNIYYFGEEVDIYEGGVIVGHEGEWVAGENGALPGLIMPSVSLLGARYMQEIAPGVALDRARHAENGVTADTPAGTFENCIVIRESNELEPGSVGEKIYAPGVGLIFDGEIPLVQFIPPVD